MLSEVRIQVGRTAAEYIELPITVLANLDKLVLDGHIVAFRPSYEAAGEVLCLSPSQGSKTGNRKYKPVVDKDLRVVVRRKEGGLTEVFWK